MKIILIADVKKVGRKNEVKEVANGYAQNVLLPQRLAVVATPENIKRFGAEEKRKEDKKELESNLLKKSLEDINGKTLNISANSNEKGKLFETIQKRHISKAINDEFGVSIPESVIDLSEHIKSTGEHTVSLKSGDSKTSIVISIK